MWSSSEKKIQVVEYQKFVQIDCHSTYLDYSHKRYLKRRKTISFKMHFKSILVVLVRIIKFFPSVNKSNVCECVWYISNVLDYDRFPITTKPTRVRMIIEFNSSFLDGIDWWPQYHSGMQQFFVCLFTWKQEQSMSCILMSWLCQFSISLMHWNYLQNWIEWKNAEHDSLSWFGMGLFTHFAHLFIRVDHWRSLSAWIGGTWSDQR